MAGTAPTMTISPVVVRDLDLYCAIVNAGASGQDAITYVAIALAESGGNAAAISGLAPDNTRGYGLWQIEFPTHADLFPGQTVGNGDWIYLENNAAMAVKIKGMQGFTAWTTYKTGAYAAFLPRAMESQAAAVAGAKAHGMDLSTFVAQTVKADDAGLTPLVGSVALGGDLGSAATATANSAGNAAGAFAGLYQPYSGPQAGNPLLRVLEIVLGAVLLVAGLKQLTAPVTAPLTTAVRSAAKLAV